MSNCCGGCGGDEKGHTKEKEDKPVQSKDVQQEKVTVQKENNKPQQWQPAKS